MPDRDWRGPAVGVRYAVRERGVGRGARRANGDLEMSFKHFGAAVAVASLLAGFPIAPVELAQGTYGIKGISDFSDSGPFGAVSPVLAADSSQVAKADGADAPNTRSSPPANVPESGNQANVLPAATSSNYSIPPVIDPLLLQTTFDKGNSNNAPTQAKAPARPPDPPVRSARAPTLHSRATLPPAGCSRCVREAARPSVGRVNVLSVLLAKNFFHKSASVRPRHPVATVGRQSGVPVLTASTVLDAVHQASGTE